MYKSTSFYKIGWISFVLFLSVFSAQAQFKVVGYLVNWSNFVTGANAVDYNKVTHINVAFVNPTDNSGTLGPLTSLSTVVNTVHTNSAKILVSLGGAGANATYWSAQLASASSQTAFIALIMQMVSDYNLDGIDIDIEGDLLNGTTITSAQYESFVTELGTALHAQNKVMSAALGSWFGYRVTNAAAQQFDWINAMAYDACGTWTAPCQHSSYSFAVSDLQYWNNKGVDKDHLVLGVPSYGYQWPTNSSTGSYSRTYANIVTLYPRAVNQDSIVPATGQYLYYNGIPTIKDKTALAITNASGIMMWTLQNDFPTSNPASLIAAIDEVVQATLHNSPPTVSLTAPSSNVTVVEGDTLAIAADASDSDGSIESVSFYSSISSTVTSLGTDATPAYNATWICEGPGTYTVYAKAKDNAYATGTSANVTVTINTPTQARSFGGPYPIPGKIEAENFDFGKELGYHDLDAANQGGAYRTTSVDIENCTDTGGGYSIGYVQAGEWLSYTVNVTATGTYNLAVRVASTTTGQTFHVEVGGVNVSGAISVPNTGGWQTWQTVTIPNVSLTQGQQALKLAFDSGNFNVNYVSFTSTVTGITGSYATGDVHAVCSPNPLSANSTLRFTLADAGRTKVTISDVIGGSVKVISDEYLSAGDHEISINGSAFTSGMYICTVNSGGKTQAIKLIKE